MNITNRITILFRLLRPQQWLKNIFVLLPLFFGGALLQQAPLLQALIAFISFCMVASAIYCLNDVVDAPSDRLHDIKRHRPVASGAVTTRKALSIAAILTIAAIALPMTLPQTGWKVSVVIAAYALINIAYCLWIKQIAVLDVCVIAFGFVMRLLAGSTATEIPLSHWIVLMTFLLTLFMALSKRRDDVLKYDNTGIIIRKNITRYNITFLNQAITITATITIVCYIMYTVSPEVTQRFDNSYIYLTSLPVIIGILRYIQLTIVDGKSGSPTHIMLHDLFLQIVLLLWTLSFFIILYVL